MWAPDVLIQPGPGRGMHVISHSPGHSSDSFSLGWVSAPVFLPSAPSTGPGWASLALSSWHGHSQPRAAQSWGSIHGICHGPSALSRAHRVLQRLICPLSSLSRQVWPLQLQGEEEGGSCKRQHTSAGSHSVKMGPTFKMLWRSCKSKEKKCYPFPYTPYQADRWPPGWLEVPKMSSCERCRYVQHVSLSQEARSLPFLLFLKILPFRSAACAAVLLIYCLVIMTFHNMSVIKGLLILLKDHIPQNVWARCCAFILKSIFK